MKIHLITAVATLWSCREKRLTPLVLFSRYRLIAGRIQHHSE